MEENIVSKKVLLIGGIFLFIASISFSYAYFVSRTIVEGNGTQVQGTTVSLEDTNVYIEGSLNIEDLNIYPGHQVVSRIKVNAQGDKNVLYNLVWKGENNLKTKLKYTVYKTSSEESPSITCEKQSMIENGAQKFYETCTESNFTNLGEVISTGGITTTTEKTTFKLVKNEEIQATSTGEVVYYYVVLEYPNEGNQNLDIHGTFNGTVTIEVLEKNERCKGIACEVILSHNTIDDSRSSGYFPETLEEDTAGKIFSSEDNDGPTYFFAGASPNNWVKFGQYQTNIYYGYDGTTSTSYSKGYPSLEECQNASNFNNECKQIYNAGSDIYWRIIRINGDGSIRLIYNGPTTVKEEESTKIKHIAFNSKSDDNAYVGYMYGTAGSSTHAETHANTTSSTIKSYLDTWYEENLKSNYGQYIDINAGFCGDRSVNDTEEVWASYDTKLGFAKKTTYYAPYSRAYNTHIATYKCNLVNDYYTVSTSSRGNKALDNPIGLITADEVMYAGGTDKSNYYYWLRTNHNYWTISPGSFNGNYTSVYSVDNYGKVSNFFNVDYSAGVGVRPVINLRADVELAGSGTKTDPFRIVDLD